jgi:hypothetical protein
MSDKAPGKPNGKETRQDTQREASSQAAQAQQRVRLDAADRPTPPVTEPGACWYSDPGHQPALGGCPRSCRGAVMFSERAGNGDQHFYCDTHAYWRRGSIQVPLVWRLPLGERPDPSASLPGRRTGARHPSRAGARPTRPAERTG